MDFIPTYPPTWAFRPRTRKSKILKRKAKFVPFDSSTAQSYSYSYKFILRADNTLGIQMYSYPRNYRIPKLIEKSPGGSGSGSENSFHSNFGRAELRDSNSKIQVPQLLSFFTRTVELDDSGFENGSPIDDDDGYSDSAQSTPSPNMEIPTPSGSSNPDSESDPGIPVLQVLEHPYVRRYGHISIEKLFNDSQISALDFLDPELEKLDIMNCCLLYA